MKISSRTSAVGMVARERLQGHRFLGPGMIFVSTSGGLYRAHVTWLEYALVNRATATGRCRLDNGNEAAAISEGPIFRPVDRHGRLSSQRLSAHAVALIVKWYAEAAGMCVNSFSGHSLRAGFVTSAARADEPERRIMRQTGHKSIEMVLRYVRQANAFTDNAALALGL